jgi:hypothetical protein
MTGEGRGVGQMLTFSDRVLGEGIVLKQIVLKQKSG